MIYNAISSKKAILSAKATKNKELGELIVRSRDAFWAFWFITG